MNTNNTLKGWVAVSPTGKLLYSSFTQVDMGGRIGWVSVQFSMCWDYSSDFDNNDFNSDIRFTNITSPLQRR